MGARDRRPPSDGVRGPRTSGPHGSTTQDDEASPNSYNARMTWWLWLVGGLLLVVLEVVTPSGFFIIFFGLAALSVGLLARFAGVEAGWVQWSLFTALSIAYLLLFRGRLQARVQAPPPAPVDSLVGVLAIAQERVAPGVVGRVEVRGSAWSARNTSDVTLEAGQRCKVVSVDGLLLTVVPE